MKNDYQLLIEYLYENNIDPLEIIRIVNRRTNKVIYEELENDSMSNLKDRSWFRFYRLLITRYFVPCGVCFKYKSVQVHHKTFSREKEGYWDLLPVCRKCHEKIHHS